MTIKQSEIEKVNQYIAENQKNVDSKYRHHYHVMAPIGWINDPNGFVFYQGEYHLFYQYHPYSSDWGPMHWGHSKSKDLVHWEDLPVALMPDQAYDKDGCFSGSAIEKDGKLYLMYTGHVINDDVVFQTQCMAVSEDGIHFEKFENNPVISAKQVESYGSIHDFRDPKIFQHDDLYYSVIATKSSENRGRILLFSSIDLMSWQFVSILLEGDESQGIMWECPDLFHLDGKDVLIMSPIQIQKQGFEYHNISSTVAFIGQMDWQTGKLLVENYHEIDFGMDFYAPQTLEDEQGRRIMIAWMQMWDRTRPTHDLGHQWSGAMTLPRELAIRDNFLVQSPPHFIYDNIKIQAQYQNIPLKAEPVVFSDLIDDATYLKIVVDLRSAQQLEIRYAQHLESALILQYNVDSQCFTFSRANFGHLISGNEPELLVERSAEVLLKNQILEIELFRDTSSIELFINGQVTMSNTFYEHEKGKDLIFSVEGEANILELISGNIN